jgi:hypothetical protein
MDPNIFQIAKSDDDAALLVQSSTILDDKFNLKSAEAIAASQHQVYILKIIYFYFFVLVSSYFTSSIELDIVILYQANRYSRPLAFFYLETLNTTT